ncbi:acetoacetyl-CoA synthetase [Actinocorallia herbida]|uniref:Acetoacetyl-CoA synthetase n=1 Tax=Actinocorallia herbida TaxID=58109 RepID=A0A3N1D252_9ACTN|nr:acetoacetate--CoA ligase [Actinocorallia herbida]ROO87592.1 acetoacetyl-CoA synthetase [Actinocorallia herbida]
MSEVLSTPHPEVRANSRIGHYLRWLADERGLAFEDYPALHRWSITDLPGFWSSIWEYFEVKSHVPPTAVLGRRTMPGAEWFPGSTLNYAEHAVGRGADTDRVAVVARSQTRPDIELTYGDLRDQVSRVRAGLRKLGVGRGDRVVAYLPNIPETLVAFLATASLGAVWAVCAPEFGARSVIDRFGQLEPKVLLTVGGYRFGVREVDKAADVTELVAGLPTLDHVVSVPYGPFSADGTPTWDDLVAEEPDEGFEPVPFDHPLFVLFTSGTTGKPKAITHKHGGILLEQLKNHALSWDLGRDDRMLWFTTTAWMLWHALVGALLLRASIVMIDGDPAHPDLRGLWRLAEETGTSVLGAGPPYLMACRKAGIHPGADFRLPRLRQLSVAGSPLSVEGYHWIREQFGDRVLLNVGSGGTDVCTGVVQGSPWQPVWAGEISGPCLGVAAQAFDPQGEPVVGELGELVITQPMPSMPLGFWGDEDGSRYAATYFTDFPGVWRFGDWVRFAAEGHCVIAGRSDATLNRGGVRLGTADFYAVVEEFAEIEDSLIVHLEDSEGGAGELLLFVKATGTLDDGLRERLKAALRAQLSPRHVPDQIAEVPLVPRNRTGKKLEVPAKRILLGARTEDVASRDVLADPGSLDFFTTWRRP